jgi:hypothetical protein
MLRSSFTGLRYRPDVVPRRLRAARIELESTQAHSIRRIVVRYRHATSPAR